jgi:hypothetical protein
MMAFLPELQPSSTSRTSRPPCSRAWPTSSRTTPTAGLRTRMEDYQGKQVERGTKVTLEWPRTKDRYPASSCASSSATSAAWAWGTKRHLQLQGDDQFVYRTDVPQHLRRRLEFGIYGLSNYDRDLMSDTVVQAITMGELERMDQPVPQELFGPTYDYDERWPTRTSRRARLTTGTSSRSTPTPSAASARHRPRSRGTAEDEQLYLKQYRVSVMGEFYSVPPVDRSTGFVEKFRVPLHRDLGGSSRGRPDDEADWF